VGIGAGDNNLFHSEIARVQRAAYPFVDEVIRSIPLKDRESFSGHQIAALSDALTRFRISDALTQNRMGPQQRLVVPGGIPKTVARFCHALMEKVAGIPANDHDFPHTEIARVQRAAYPFVDGIIRSIPLKDRESFSPCQIAALSDALTRTRMGAHHIIDARTVLPLFFTRFYGMFLFGKDKRAAVRPHPVEHKGSLLSGLVLAALVTLLIAGFLLVVLLAFIYLLKTALGIDIFPDAHLWDFLSG